MTPSLSDRLINAAHLWEAKTGLRPTHLYLGHTEHSDLMHEIAPGVSAVERRARGNSFTWNGIKIVEVHEASHIGYGIEIR